MGVQNNLLYDFYRDEFWLRRFSSIDDAINENFKLFRSVLTTFDQLTRSQFEQLILDVKQETPQTFHYYFDDLFSDFQASLPVSAALSYESSLDVDFEAKQLFNLYTLCLSLNSFALGRLLAIVKNVLATSRESGKLPPTYAIRECFRQVTTDVEFIQRALVQRRRETDAGGSYMMSAPAKALLVADKLAFLALAPFRHLVPSALPLNPITFFSQSTYIRRVPYNESVLLIGISYDVMPPELNRRFSSIEELRSPHPPFPAFEFMVIPHEVGHYIYHHARLEGGGTFAVLSRQFQTNPYFMWCEETFADIYGCIVAGPLTPLGLQSLLASSDDDRVCANDGAHPPAILRPFILSEILRVLHHLAPNHYPFSDVAHQLSDNWGRILVVDGHQVMGGGTENGRFIIQPKDSNAINVTEVLETMKPIIEAFASQLLQQATFILPWSSTPYGNLNEYDTDMAQLTNRDFACKPIPNHTLIALEQGYDDNLLSMLTRWGDSGPTGGGGGTYQTQAENGLNDPKAKAKNK
ncbi:MAG: hypothetical protein R3C62_09575 [Chloroflexota bacterium]